MLTTKDKLTEMLMGCGMFESQANPIMELAIPALNKQAYELNGLHEVDGVMVAKNPYTIHWDVPSDHYPAAVYNAWFLAIKPIALQWIDTHKPQAWFRDMFK
jgi:hypothetical protein